VHALHTRAPIVLATVLVSIGFAACDSGGVPSRELAGTVKGTVSSPSDTGPTGQVATVVFADGSQVVANVLVPAMVSSGQQVRVRETTGAVTGGKTYEIVGIAKQK
jgi:hypothetical protein